METVRLLAALLWLASGATAANAELKLASVFGDHMVLQRGVDIPVWGWAGPGERVTVTLGAAVRETKAALGGRWEVRFPPLTAGGPLAMAVTGSDTLDYPN